MSRVSTPIPIQEDDPTLIHTSLSGHDMYKYMGAQLELCGMKLYWLDDDQICTVLTYTVDLNARTRLKQWLFGYLYDIRRKERNGFYIPFHLFDDRTRYALDNGLPLAKFLQVKKEEVRIEQTKALKRRKLLASSRETKLTNRRISRHHRKHIGGISDV